MEEAINKIIQRVYYENEDGTSTYDPTFKPGVVKELSALFHSQMEEVRQKIDSLKYYNPEPLTDEDSYNHAIDEVLAEIKYVTD